MCTQVPGCMYEVSRVVSKGLLVLMLQYLKGQPWITMPTLGVEDI